MWLMHTAKMGFGNANCDTPEPRKKYQWGIQTLEALPFTNKAMPHCGSQEALWFQRAAH